MSAVTRARVLAGAAASLLVLSGCAAEPQLPPGPTEAEVRAIIDEQNEMWWSSMFPDEPQPVVEPIAYLGEGDTGLLINDCVADSAAGLATSDDGVVIYPEDAEGMRAFDRAWFICTLKYPTDWSRVDAAERGFLSEPQIDWMYGYLTERTAPCLRALGFALPEPPERQAYLDGYHGGSTWWDPYYQAVPSIQEDDWEWIDFRCPPPPIGPAHHP